MNESPTSEQERAYHLASSDCVVGLSREQAAAARDALELLMSIAPQEALDEDDRVVLEQVRLELWHELERLAQQEEETTSSSAPPPPPTLVAVLDTRGYWGVRDPLFPRVWLSEGCVSEQVALERAATKLSLKRGQPPAEPPAEREPGLRETSQALEQPVRAQQPVRRPILGESALEGPIFGEGSLEVLLGHAGWGARRRNGGEFLSDGYETPEAALTAARRKLSAAELTRDAFEASWGPLYADDELVLQLWEMTEPSAELAVDGDDGLRLETARRVAAAIAVMAYGVDALKPAVEAQP